MWQQPKTDWRAGPGETFNIQDYNRIKGNLETILQSDMVNGSNYPDLGPDKNYTDYSFYADEMNQFEDTLEQLCKEIYPFAIGERGRVYADNTPFLAADELNRIESACLLIHQVLEASAAWRPRLAFVLNGGDF